MRDKVPVRGPTASSKPELDGKASNEYLSPRYGRRVDDSLEPLAGVARLEEFRAEEDNLRLKVAIVAAVAALGIIPMASPAQASTCAVYDPELEYVVCDLIYKPVVGTACGLLSKWGGCA